MVLSFVPESGSVLDVLEKIAEANEISNFNLVGYNYQEDTYECDPCIHFITPVDLSKDKAYIASSIKSVENSSNSFMGISSLVRLKNSKSAHLFQLDYDGSLSANNLEQFCGKLDAVSKSLIRGKADPFYIFRSGSGHHVYGGIMECEEFDGFLNALYGLGIADPKWIDLSKYRGFGNLRISKNSYKQSIPLLIGKIV